MSPTPIAEAAWIAVTIDRLFAPLRLLVGEDNPLAVGHYCPTCGTRLDKPERPCPMCRTARLREVQSSAALKVGHDSRFVGVGVLLAIASAA